MAEQVNRFIGRKTEKQIAAAMTFFVVQVDVFPSELGFHISFQTLTHGMTRGHCCVSLTIWKCVSRLKKAGSSGITRPQAQGN